MVRLLPYEASRIIEPASAAEAQERLVALVEPCKLQRREGAPVLRPMEGTADAPGFELVALSPDGAGQVGVACGSIDSHPQGCDVNLRLALRISSYVGLGSFLVASLGRWLAGTPRAGRPKAVEASQHKHPNLN